MNPAMPPDNQPYFRPSNSVTRGQLLKMVVNAAGWPLLNPATGTFEDVPVGSTFYTYIETGVSHGIINGYPCGGVGEPCSGPGNRPYFRPSNNITRGQLSKVIALARGFALPTPVAGTFEDVPPGSTFFGYVEAMAAQGIVAGYPCGGIGEPCQPPGEPALLPPQQLGHPRPGVQIRGPGLRGAVNRGCDRRYCGFRWVGTAPRRPGRGAARASGGALVSFCLLISSNVTPVRIINHGIVRERAASHNR